jgi:3-isopropylmalate/(R)-2-methylmalate dehydratase small subunit
VPAIVLPAPEVDRLMALAQDPATCEMRVNLESQTITTLADGKVLPFAFDPLRKHMLLNGLDAVGLTLQYADDIHRFEQDYFKQRPWLAA